MNFLYHILLGLFLHFLTSFQGVETPSQSRYVGYFERMHLELGNRLPPPRALVLRRVELRGMAGVGSGDGSDLSLQVDVGRANQVYSAHLGFRRNCRVSHIEEEALVRVELLNCPRLEGDVRLLFRSSSRAVPKGYEECPFYLWFNTSFLVSFYTLQEAIIIAVLTTSENKKVFKFSNDWVK